MNPALHGVGAGFQNCDQFSTVIHGSRAVDYLLVYAPRDNEDLKIIWLIVQASYAFARGAL